MRIRPPVVEDIEALVEMGLRMHSEGAYAFLPYERDKVSRLVRSYVDDSVTQCGLVAEVDRTLVGMLGGYLTEYFFCSEVVACDMVLFVDQPYRRGQAAVRLVRAFRDWALGRGARELCLAISTNVNVEDTGRFYERLGFTRVGGIYKQRLRAD